MPAPHTAATATAAAEQPAAVPAAKLLLPSETTAVPPAAPASPPPPPAAPPSTSTPSSAPFVSAAALAAIADIESKGEASGDADAVAELVAGLEGEALKTVPCSFLYDGPGSALYDAITDLEAYYPYGAETRLLDAQSDAIASAIPENAVLVELGCGSATKTPRLLAAVARKNEEKRNGNRVRYAGIDVSADFLANARANVMASGAVADADVETFCNRYLEGAAAARAAHRGEDLCFLWLGSSVGNLDAGSAAAFVRELFAAAASSDGGKEEEEGNKGGKTQLLLCTDLWKDERRLRAAYDDDKGVTAAFMRNGLRHALACVEVLEPEKEEGKRDATSTATATTATAATTTALRVAAAAGAAPAAWRYEVDVNPVDEQVEMYLVCPAAFELRILKKKKNESEEKESGDDDSSAAAAVSSSVVRFAKGERVLMEVSRKYTLERIEALAASSGVRLAGRWVTEDYGIQLLE